MCAFYRFALAEVSRGDDRGHVLARKSGGARGCGGHAMITPVHVSGALDNRSATWVNVIRNRAQHRPERVLYTFLVDGDARESRLTDRELDQRARAIAGKLQQLLPGDRVLLLYL